MTRTSRRRPAHRAEPVGRARRGVTPKGLLLSALSASGAVVLGVVAGGGTFAFFTSSASVASAATITSGTATLSMTQPTGLSGLYPGQARYGASTVTNTGDVPLSLELSGLTAPSNAFSSALVITLGASASAQDCSAGRLTSGWDGRLADFAASALPVTIAPGEATTLCVGLALPSAASAAAEGGSAPLTITLTGTQVRS